MSSDTASPLVPPQSQGQVWYQSRALWAGCSIVAMWLAVLFVGVFGGNIVSSTPGGSSSSVPVVVVVALCALIATSVVAHAGLRRGVEEPKGTFTAGTEAPAQTTPQSSGFRPSAA